MPLTKLNSASVIERLPTGSVLQTVTAISASANSGGVEGSWIDVVTLDITPKNTSSKIFAQLSCTGYGSGTGDIRARGRIYNSTSTDQLAFAGNMFYRDGSGNIKASGSFLQGLDSPNSTSVQTYKAQAFLETASNHNLFWDSANGGQWVLSLMEIKG